jgi:hypothetical protein
MSRPQGTPFSILLIDDDRHMNKMLRRLIEGHRVDVAGLIFAPKVEAVNVALTRYKRSYWRVAEETLLALQRASARLYDLVMIDFGFADEEAQDILWGKDRSRVASKKEAKGRLLTIRDLGEQYAKSLAARRRAPKPRNLFLEARRVLLRSMAPNLGIDILGPVFPNRLNETRAAFPNAHVRALDPRNEFYAGDTYYHFYEQPRGRDFYRQLVGSHYLRIVEAYVLRALVEATQDHGSMGPTSSPGHDVEINVFLSYSKADSQYAKRLHSRLIDRGFSAYLAEKALRGGDSFSNEIRAALRRSQELWILVTPASLQSEWVMTEWGAAWALGKRIVPILLRCNEGDLPDRLRSLHCVDYAEINSLLTDLTQRLGDLAGGA